MTACQTRLRSISGIGTDNGLVAINFRIVGDSEVIRKRTLEFEGRSNSNSLISGSQAAH